MIEVPVHAAVIGVSRADPYKATTRPETGSQGDSLWTFVVVCLVYFVRDHLGPLFHPLGADPLMLLIDEASDKIRVTQLGPKPKGELHSVSPRPDPDPHSMTVDQGGRATHLDSLGGTVHVGLGTVSLRLEVRQYTQS